jgi:hypothetical protein
MRGRRAFTSREVVVLEPGFERVHTVPDYWDGPRRGVAHFEGRPHLYESDWEDRNGNHSFTFLLSPVDPRLFGLALEAWAIWRRWETAFHQGLTTKDTHPALPDERSRCEELREILERELKIDERNCVRAEGEFRSLDDPEWNGLGWPPLQAKWTRR